MGRQELLIAFAFMAFARVSCAIDLTWPDGVKDLTVSSAAACTLLVHSTPGDSVFRSPWRLIWRGTSEVAEPVGFIAAPGTRQTPGPFTVFRDPSLADSISNALTAVFAVSDSCPHASSAMYVVYLDPTLHARFSLAPLSSQHSENPSLDSLPSVTVNGGCSEPYGPLIFSAAREVSQGRQMRMAAAPPVVTVSGFALSQVASASVISTREGGASHPATILTQSDSSMTLELSSDDDPVELAMILTDAGGLSSAVLLDPAVPTLVQSSLSFSSYCIAPFGFAPTFGWNSLLNTPSVVYQGSFDSPWCRYAYLTGGGWQYETVPDSVAPSPVAGDQNPLVFDKNGVLNYVGRYYGVADALRLSGSPSSWILESFYPDTAPLGFSTNMDTSAWAPISTGSTCIAYVARPAGDTFSHLYFTERTGPGAWSFPVEVEGRSGSVVAQSFNLDVGPGLLKRIAYFFYRPGFEPTVRLACTDALGSWPYEFCMESGGIPNPYAISVCVDSMSRLPVFVLSATAVQNNLPYIWVGQYDENLGVYIWSPIVQTSVPCRQVVGRMTSGGILHIVAYMANDLNVGWASIVHFTPTGITDASPEGRSLHERRAGILGPEGLWAVDTVVTSGKLGAGGRPSYGFGFMLDGEVPVIGFAYASPESGFASSRVYVASVPGEAAARPASRGRFALLGPWPNPTISGRGGRLIFQGAKGPDVEVDLFDVTGTRVRREVRRAVGDEFIVIQWDLAGLRPGVYWVRARSGLEAGFVRKWIVLR